MFFQLLLRAGMLVMLLATRPSFADEIYTYTGTSYDWFAYDLHAYGPYSSANFLSAEFIVDSAIQPNNFNTVLQPKYWRIWDGSFSISSTEPSTILTGVSITTDSTGAVVSWNFGARKNWIDQTGHDSNLIFASQGCNIGCSSGDSSYYGYYQQFWEMGQFGYYSYYEPKFVVAGNSAAGTWAITPVPEPSEWLLMLIGGFWLATQWPKLKINQRQSNS